MYAEMPPCSPEAASDWRQLMEEWRSGGRLHSDDLQELVLRGETPAYWEGRTH